MSNAGLNPHFIKEVNALEDARDVKSLSEYYRNLESYREKAMSVENVRMIENQMEYVQGAINAIL